MSERHDEEDALEEVWAERERYVAWTARRVATREDAEDVVQHAMARAARRGDQLGDARAARGWFWVILRRSLSDHLSARDARREGFARLEQVERASPQGHEPAVAGAVCACSLEELARMPEEARELLRRVTLEEEPIAEVARDLGLTPNATRVRAHRARAAMRERLEHRCGTHSVQSCMSCDC